MYLLIVLALLTANGSNFAATSPIHNHALHNSPLFNTPLAPPPAALGSIFHRVIPLSRRQTLHPVGAPRVSNHDDSYNVTATAVTTPRQPAPATLTTTMFSSFLADPAVLSTTTVFVPAGSAPPSTAVSFTSTVTMTVPVTTLTLEPSTVTVTALPPETSTLNKTGQLSVQSITILETVPFTTTDLPAVTVTGLQTLTSVVVIPVEETSAADIPLRPNAAAGAHSSRE